mgnify:CR=1 FL=1
MIFGIFTIFDINGMSILINLRQNNRIIFLLTEFVKQARGSKLTEKKNVVGSFAYLSELYRTHVIFKREI